MVESDFHLGFRTGNVLLFGGRSHPIDKLHNDDDDDDDDITGVLPASCVDSIFRYSVLSAAKGYIPSKSVNCAGFFAGARPRPVSRKYIEIVLFQPACTM